MSWVWATLKALGWAVAAVAACLVVLVSGLVGGWQVYVGVLAVVPALAYLYHRSWRIAALTAGWEVLTVGVLLVCSALAVGEGLSGFRGPSG